MNVILGGGISGLSAGYYLLRHVKPSSIQILEATDRLGGWVQSKSLPDHTIFETGPHTIRVAGAGLNTLSLVEEIGLQNKIIPLLSSHPAAKTQLVCLNNKLLVVPNSLKQQVMSNELLSEPLIFKLIKEFFKPAVKKNDETVYSFFERRFGKDVADNLASAIVCGICAGDAQKISMKSLFKDLFYAEQTHGSLIKAGIKTLTSSVFTKNANKTTNVSPLLQIAKEQRWRAWGLQGGLETLPSTIANILRNNGVKIKEKHECQKIKFHSNHIEYVVNGEPFQCDRMISSLSAKEMAKLLQEQHPRLADELNAIPTVTVAVVNLTYSTDIVPITSFGFLVPPKEKLPILGVIFDSCIFSQSKSVLTVMMGGAWFKEHFGDSPKKDYLLDVAVKHVKKLLSTEEDPTRYNVSVLRDCIPQYIVGHTERVARIRDYISKNQMPLALCGSSYQGVGINDVILSAKQAVSDISNGT